MTVEIVEIPQLCGPKAMFYSVAINGASETLFVQFLTRLREAYPDEIRKLTATITMLANERGAQERYFKMQEGSSTDNIVALYDTPDRKLRLYCLRFGSATVIIGGGGAKTTRTYEDDPALHREVMTLQKVSKIIDEAIKERDLIIDDNGRILCPQKLDDYEDYN